MRLRLAAPFIVLALTVAGCGGGQATVQEVPGGPVQLTTPGGTALAPTATPTAGATATPTATTTSAASSSSTSTQPTTTSSTTAGAANGGTEAPAATATPAPGSNAQQFEDFCAQNPDAC